MTPSDLRFELARNMYTSQRSRREEVRSGVATPVAALAFSVFNLSTLATYYAAGQWMQPVNLAIGILALLSIGSLITGAGFIVRMEWNVIYMDPPDLQEIVRAERAFRRMGSESDEALVACMQDVMAGAYDIVYRRYFAANEQAARDRTRGLHYMMGALVLLSLAYALLPFQAGKGLA